MTARCDAMIELDFHKSAQQLVALFTAPGVDQISALVLRLRV
jgi:hypothetical protein